jgi:cell division transport system ATP-binding protein
MEVQPIIKLNNIDVFQNSQLVLSNVNLEVKKGEFVFLIGATGSGKSSLLKIIYKELDLKTGIAQIAGYDLLKLKTKDVPFLRRKLGIV